MALITGLLHGDKAKKDMSRVSELSGRQLFQNLIGSGNGMRSDLRSGEFISDIYNEETSTPHAEMRATQKAYRTHSFVATASKLVINSLFGREVTVECEDSKTKRFHEKNTLPKLMEPLREAAEGYVVSGNGYVHKQRISDKVVNFEAISRPEKMWIDYTKGFKPVSYVLEQPRSINKENTDVDIKDYEVAYFDRKRRVHGVKYMPGEIIHFKQGTSHLPVYGRSTLASSLDDLKILRELLRDMAIIARYKAIPKKLWKLSRGKDGQHQVSNAQEEEFRKYINSLGDWENPVLGSINADVEDLTHKQTIEMIEPLTRMLTQNVTNTLGPNFYLNGDVTNYAVAKEQKNVFFLTIESMRDDFRKQINDVLREVSEQRGLSTDVSISFGDFDFPTREDRVKEATAAFTAGGLTINEYREELELEPVPETSEGGVGDLFSWDVKQGGGLQDQIQQALKGLPEPTNDLL